MQFDEASKALVEFAASRHNAFHPSEAADIPTSRLRRAEQRGEVTRLSSRVWSITALGAPPGQQLRTATLDTAGATACHRGSGRLHQWFDSPGSPSDIWVPAPGRRVGSGIRQHQAAAVDPDRDVTEIEGIRTLNAAVTLCLLGRVEPDEVIENCLDLFLRDHSQTWLIETLDRLWSNTGAGPAALRRILNHPARRLGPAESVLERRVQRILAGADLPPIVLQHEVAVGGRRYRIDLAMPTIKLGVESHGRRFHWGRRAEEADNHRDLMLAAAGWQLLYVTWDQLREPIGLRERITEAARTRLLDGATAWNEAKPRALARVCFELQVQAQRSAATAGQGRWLVSRSAPSRCRA